MKRVNNKFISICIIISLASVGLCEKSDDKNCRLFDNDGYELSDYEWRYGVTLPTIEDTAKPGTELLKYKQNHIYYIESVSDPADNYVHVDYDEQHLYIKLREKFKEYEEHESKTKLSIKVQFNCDNYKYRNIEFTLNIKDTNNHAPQFLDAPYKFNLPMPIPKGYDLESFGKIVARDIDLTNERITFEFKKNDDNNSGFSIVSNKKQDKNYPAKFMAGETMDLEKEITLVLYATDSGKPSLTSNTTITITVDQENSAPRFSHSLYTADLTNIKYDKVNNEAVNFTQGIITLERGYEGVRAFEISGVPEEHKKHLELKHSGILRRKNIELQLELVDLTEEFFKKQKVLSLVVTAVKDHVKAQTAIEILLPGEEVISNSNTSEKSPTCEEQTATEDDSTTGYMIATIALSVTTLGLTVYIIYTFIKRS